MKHSLDTRHEYLIELIHVIYEAKGLNEMAHELFSRLRQLFSFQSALLLPVARYSFEMQRGYCQDCAEENMELYLRHYAALDPLVQQAFHPALLNHAVRLSDAASAHYLSQSEFNSFLQIVRFRYSLGATAGWRETPLAAIRWYRAAAEPDFSNTEIELVNRLAAHVGRAIYLLEAGKREQPSEDMGLSVFAPDKRMIFSNAAAKKALEGSSPAAVLEAVAGGQAIWRKSELENYRAQIIPLRPPSLFRWLDRSTRQARVLDHGAAVAQPNGFAESNITIIATQPFQKRQAIAKRLAWHQLSPREIEVSFGVMRGLSNSDIAQQLFIDEKTVKDHLRHIFAKTSVHSRTKLISNILGLDTELFHHRELA